MGESAKFDEFRRKVEKTPQKLQNLTAFLQISKYGVQVPNNPGYLVLFVHVPPQNVDIANKTYEWPKMGGNEIIRRNFGKMGEKTQKMGEFHGKRSAKYQCWT